MTGKEKCNLLKTIRKELAEQNDINIQFDECTHTGDCKGTCPKCDAELKYIDDELKKKANRGEPVIIPTGNEEIEQDNSKNHPPKINLKEFRPIKKIKEMIDKILYEGYMGGEIYDPEGNTEPNKANNLDNRVKIGMDDRIHHTYEEIQNVRNGALDSLGLSEMSYSCMKMAGKNTVRDILAMTKEELEHLKNTNTPCYYDITYKVDFWELEFDYEKRKK